jgi:two-component system response regulator NreC
MPSRLRLAGRAPEEAPDRSIRVVLADDHSLMRRGLRRLLDEEQDVQVIAEAGDLASAAQQVRRHRPQVLVLDLGMPDGSSIEAIGELRDRAPETQIVVLTSDDSPVFARRAIAAGAVGFVMKELADGELGPAVHAASRGEEYVGPRMAARLDAFAGTLTENKLTQREAEVLRLIALGHTSVEIADKLQLSPRTIETHRAHICRKLGLGTRAELVRYALQRRLIGA